MNWIWLIFVSEIFGTNIKSKKSEHVWGSAFSKKQIFPEKNLQICYVFSFYSRVNILGTLGIFEKSFQCTRKLEKPSGSLIHRHGWFIKCE